MTIPMETFITRVRVMRAILLAAVAAVLIVVWPESTSFAQQGALAPVAKQQFFSDNGDPCGSCQLSTFITGTSTPLATYSDAGLTTPNANPVILDAAGRATIYLTPSTAYKFVFKTAAGVTVWTVDPVTAANASANAIGEFWTFGGMDGFWINGIAAYPSGTGLDTCVPATNFFNSDSANIPIGTYKLEAMGLVISGADTLTIGLMNLTDGAPDTPLVTLAFTSATASRQQSGAITFATGGSAKNYCVKWKLTASTGYVWGIRIVRTS